MKSFFSTRLPSLVLLAVLGLCNPCGGPIWANDTMTPFPAGLQTPLPPKAELPKAPKTLIKSHTARHTHTSRHPKKKPLGKHRKKKTAHPAIATLPPLRIMPFSNPIPANITPYTVPALPENVSIDISRWRLLYEKPDKMVFLDTQTIQQCDSVSGNDCVPRLNTPDALHSDAIQGYVFWARYLLKPVRHAAALQSPAKYYLNCDKHEINGYDIIPETPDESFYSYFCNIENH